MKLTTLKTLIGAALIATLGACSTPGPGEAPDGIWDPNEATNRKVHEFNKSIDRAFVRSSGNGFAAVTPSGVRYNINSLADNLSTPNTVLNQLLQGDLRNASRNTLRFAVNLTAGFGGIADPATELGLPYVESDFGETLAVWGVPEGAYQELPVLGPSTERATAGRVLDFLFDPMGYVLQPPESYYATGVRIAARVGSRGAFSDTIDSVLYDSADSYAQTRLIYLQNRRHDVGVAPDVSDIDPYAIETEGF